MQSKLGDGSIMISGVAGKDAETKRVGEKNSVLTKFSVRVGERMVGDEKKAIWVNCTAWNDMGKAASLIKKGDTVLAVGKIKKSSYTGNDGQEKEKTELICEFINAVCRDTLPEIGAADPASSAGGDYEYNPNDQDLPF